MRFNAINENKILAKISEFTVSRHCPIFVKAFNYFLILSVLAAKVLVINPKNNLLKHGEV